MGILDNLLGVPGGGGDAMSAITGLLNGHEGGIGGLVQAFEQGGLGEIAQSWVSTGGNLPVSADQIQAVLGSGVVAQFAEKLGVDPQEMARGLAAYTGVRRRFDYRGRVGSIRVYDDYAHHPTEVAATLSAARPVAGAGRVVVIFQPHLYSRTVAFAAEFARALAVADVVVVLDVYGAREDPVPGVTGELIARAIPDGTAEVHYLPSMARVPASVAALLRPDDLVLTMGAGDVTMVGPEVLRELDERATAGDDTLGEG